MIMNIDGINDIHKTLTSLLNYINMYNQISYSQAYQIFMYIYMIMNIDGINDIHKTLTSLLNYINMYNQISYSQEQLDFQVISETIK